VIFERRLDGVKALKQYNNVPLDGRPMKIQLVEDGQAAAAASRPSSGQTFSRGASARGAFNTRGRSSRGAFGRGSSIRGASARGTGGNRGAARGGLRGRGGRGGRGGKPKVLTKDQLDAQLDAYNSKMDLS